MKIYIAGPMRGIPDFNFPAFKEATATLREAGHQVVSPHEKDEAVPGFDPGRAETLSVLCGADTMSWDLQQVLAAEAIVLLSGWENSRGAQLERLVAENCCKQLYLYSSGELLPAPAWDHPLISVHNRKLDP